MTHPTKNGYSEIPDAPAKAAGEVKAAKPVGRVQAWFRRNYWWALWFKLLPSLMLVSTFGRRPITIAKLAAPETVQSLALFLPYIVAPILFLALIDTVYIGLTVFQEQWNIREYVKRKEQASKLGEPDTSLKDEIEGLREKLEHLESKKLLPANTLLPQFIKNNIIDVKFKKQLIVHGLNLDVFIDLLTRKSNYLSSSTFISEQPEFAALLTLPKVDYQLLWIRFQVELARSLYKRYEHVAPTNSKDPEAMRTFMLNNIFHYELRKQLRHMKIDENKMVDLILNNELNAHTVAVKLNKNARQNTSFNFAKEWLKTEIKLIRMHQMPSLPPHLSALLHQASINEASFREAVEEKSTDESCYEFDATKIVNRFQCLTTDKVFAKENPAIAKAIKAYDYAKRVLVFPLRTISLMLAIEALFPFSLPMEIGIPVYASIGLALSAMIIFFEKMSDDYLDELKETRNTELNELHQSEQAVGINRLQLKTTQWESTQTIAQLNSEKDQHLSEIGQLRRTVSSHNLIIPQKKGQDQHQRAQSPETTSPPSSYTPPGEIDALYGKSRGNRADQFI